jgi:hypothetical protein
MVAFLLPTAVAMTLGLLRVLFRSIRALVASRAIFRPECSIQPRRRSVQPLPSAHDGCRASSLRVERIYKKRRGVCRMAGDKSPSNARRGGGVKGGGAAEGHP